MILHNFMKIFTTQGQRSGRLLE